MSSIHGKTLQQDTFLCTKALQIPSRQGNQYGNGSMGTGPQRVGVGHWEWMIQRSKSGTGAVRWVGGPVYWREGWKLQPLVGYVQEYRTRYKEGREVSRGGLKKDADMFRII